MDARERLFACKDIYDQAATEALFVEAVRDNVAHHARNCSFFASLLEQRGFDAGQIKDIRDCERIPVLPASFFKYHEALSIPRSEVEIHATSSGTQGQKSQMFFDQQTLNAGVRMVTNVMRHYGFISLLPTNYIMLGYEPAEGNEMGAAKTAMGITRFAPAVSRTFLLRHTHGGYEVDRFGVLSALKRYERQRLPVRFVGFPSYLYFLCKAMQEEGIRVKLNRNSLALLGGGWKQFDDMVIDKQDLYAMAEDRLGLQPRRCRDFYSAVEHSVAYAECANHHMHVPIWSRVVIRDVRTLEPVGFGEPGFLSFVTPLVLSAPLTSVMMGDLAVLYDGSACGCGIATPYFDVLGRAGTSRMRSCAVAASEFMGEGRK